ncbi:unnamed protein product [Notodromas monacha]|uniref:Casein kinase substrate phosphoprotein PP28 domain-containing protein n=1 Tax=Notodromas monacha TaxID=399045 RepID=A0A7R9GCG1_9CRUS|nr:unnamed protein product [Notodromas monacha]CAG0915796.1 unnamed protein product [Notodromas monacha]
MPRGRGGGGRGRGRTFTSPEELEEQRKKELRQKEWRAKRGEESESDEEGSADGSDESSEESSEEEEEEGVPKEEKRKGVSGLIEVENPNYVAPKFKKVSALDTPGEAAGEARVEGGAVQLSRREREELQKQRAKAHYQKLHLEGKTEEARADLARLAIIRKQREEAAKKKEEERKDNQFSTAKEAAEKASKAS